MLSLALGFLTGVIPLTCWSPCKTTSGVINFNSRWLMSDRCDTHTRVYIYIILYILNSASYNIIYIYTYTGNAYSPCV